MPVSQRKRQLNSVPPAAGTERSRKMRTKGRDKIPSFGKERSGVNPIFQFFKVDDRQVSGEVFFNEERSGSSIKVAEELPSPIREKETWQHLAIFQ